MSPDGHRESLHRRLIALEIRARCEEWRRSDVHDPAAARALRQLQSELRRSIWHLGIHADAAPGSRPDDPDLVAELCSVSEALRWGPGRDDPAMRGLERRVGEALQALSVRERKARGAYRTPASPDDTAWLEAFSQDVAARPAAPLACPPRQVSKLAMAGTALFVMLAFAAMAAAAAGLRWLPAAIAVLMTAWLVGLARR
jgi:hypothetical protein